MLPATHTHTPHRFAYGVLVAAVAAVSYGEARIGSMKQTQKTALMTAFKKVRLLFGVQLLIADSIKLLDILGCLLFSSL